MMNQPNDDDQDDYCNPDLFGWLGGARLSDEAITEVKGWTKSKPRTEYDEEIWRALQNDVNYYESQIGDILDVLSFEDEDEYDVRNSKIVIPERVKKLLIEEDELSRAYNLAKIKVIAYKHGVALSDDDAKKILISEAGIHLLLECDDEKSIREFHSSNRNDPVARKKYYAQLDKNKMKWKAALLPYITPMAPAPTVVDTASRSPKKPARRATRSSAKSGDSNSDPDPDPERPRQLYTFKSFAQLVDCSEKTLRNKVSAGLFPQPQKTAFGPRFTQQHLDYAVTPSKPTSRGRGRPRIADSMTQGGVQ